ncbi:MAG: integrase arm-type DNA-binding domain-containing protein [Chloroflexi bacterium]|nr:integrase arm-type DNA-binding domain-containing protein [Chloroflexota bacterium]
MPRGGKDKLSAAAVKAAAYQGRPYKLFDGAGLYLHLKEAGRYWRLKYRYAGREKLLALGVYPDVGLKAAREGRDEARRLLAQHVDPVAHKRAQESDRRAAAANSFEAVGREWWEQVHRHEVVEDHAARNLRRLELYVFPPIGRFPLRDISAPQLLAVLRKVKRRETARRVRTLCGQVLRYGISTGRAERDVAADLRDALKPTETRHHAALVDPEDLAGLLRAIEGYDGGQPATRAALRLAPLLFVRPGELRKAKWEDFDLDAGKWNYQPSKGGDPMVTPLPRQAVEILGAMHKISGPEGYVFPSLRGKGRPMSANTLSAALSQMGFKDKMTPHGFRAAARTILTERLGYSAEWVEMQLGHCVRDVNGRAYNRTTFLEQRREMLQRWADYLDHLRNGVVALDTMCTNADSR